MTKLLSAVYEHGSFKPTKPLKLPEHQKVLLAIAIAQDDIPSFMLSKLAEEADSFDFLNSAQEDIYSPNDGEEI